MDVIRRYIPNVNQFDDKHEACEQLITTFMSNYRLIINESESQFVCRYFMSAILAFCAEIDYKNYQLLDQFIRFFISNQSGIWDIWSVYQFEERQWKAIEKCLEIQMLSIGRRDGLNALKYIIEITNKLNIELTDPNDKSEKIRFIDFPRFDAIESKSDLWRNLHLPIIDCTLLPENPCILRVLLQYGAKIPILDYQMPHFIHRICHAMDTANVDKLTKKLFWIKFVIIDVPYSSTAYKRLLSIGNDIISTLALKFDYRQNDTVFDRIQHIPCLKQLARHCIRQQLRLQNALPIGIDQLNVNHLKDYLNINIL